MQRAFEDEGKTGDASPEGTVLTIEGEAASPEAAETNEWGEMDGQVVSEEHPHLFSNRGKTGTDRDNMVGGRGSTGNQGAGSIQTLNAPVYRSAPSPRAGAPARAWVRPGSGKVTVVRSYTGTRVGNNAPYYFTARACRRSDQHEELHVNSSKSIHDTNISPLERRVAAKTGPAKAQDGATAAAALAALRADIRWNPSTTAFTTADTAANTPMGTVDVADLARPDFPRDYGPRTVGGANYAHYIDVPPGP